MSGNVYTMPLKQPPSNKWLLIGLGGLFLLFLLYQTVHVVPAGQRVVVFNSITGVEEQVRSEGLNFLIPFVQIPFYYDVRTQTYTLSEQPFQGVPERLQDNPVQALTADGQTVKMDISLRYRLIASELWQLHQTVGESYVEKIVKPEVRSVVRNTVSNYSVTDIYTTRREEIQQEIQQRLNDSLSAYYIQVNELLIRNIQFSEEFAKAIEQKQVALQEAERMRYVLQREEQEKARKITEAQGVAESIRIKAIALKQNPQLIQYEYVQKLSPGIQAIITDQKTILNVGELFGKTSSGKS